MFMLKVLVYAFWRVSKFIQKVVNVTILSLILAFQTMLVLLVSGLIWLRGLPHGLEYANISADEFIDECSEDVLTDELETIMDIAKN